MTVSTIAAQMVDKLAEGVRTIGVKASVLMQGIPTKERAVEIGDEVLKHADRVEEALSRAHLIVTLHTQAEEQDDGKWSLRLYMAVQRARSISVNGASK